VEAGVSACGSSDAPVGPISPIRAISAAVTRKTCQANALTASESVEPIQALKMYTIHAAETLFVEKSAGMIAIGYPADMILLSANPLRVPVEEIGSIKVEMTLIAGNVCWSLLKGTVGS